MSAFVAIFLHQKSSTLTWKYKKASSETFIQKGAHKMFVKLSPNGNISRWSDENQKDRTFKNVLRLWFFSRPGGF